MDFSQIKDLTIPEGSVIKITDSNGVILYNKTLYRELDYIHFSGNEYIQEDFNLSTKNRRYYLEYTCDEFLQNISLLAQWDNTQNSNKRRLYIARCSDASGQAAWYIGSKYATYDMTLGAKYKSTCVYTNASSNTLTYELKDSSDTVLTSGTLVETTTSLNTIDSAAALGTTKLRDNSGVISYGGYWVGKLYKFQKYVDSTNTLQNDQVPCQRKSDGVCGLYDTINNIFYPMQGTNITTAAAGPVVDENPSWSPTILMNSYSNAGGSGTIFAVTTGTTAAETNTLLTFNQDPSYLILTCTLYHGNVGGTGTKSGAIWVKSFNDSTGTYIINNSSNSSDTQTVNSVKIQLEGSGVKTFAGCIGIAGGYTSSVELQYDKTNHILQVYRHGATQASTACRMSNITIEAYN